MRISRLAKDERGTAAIEFALLTPLLVGVIMGTVEIGLVGLVSNTLDNAVQSAARTIRTGESDAPTNATDFKTAVCNGMFESQTACGAKLAISVRKYTTFANANAAAGDAPAGEFDKGTAGDVILVKATYQWPFFMPFFNLGFQQSGPTTLVLDARTTFKNEPFT
ncbi:TadE/TadG family type IV pilus assembly protein [Phenylobacterium sp.]|uniref:TadE/TadG family type IV pilus assembly protein n=1 Tax=Phenylobacterium sp. TaxID=1871053 RepID=UPI002DF15C3F|nr:TadE/TadG family type IV pilus assembly protein [Phenylobacterium sp.]